MTQEMQIRVNGVDKPAPDVSLSEFQKLAEARAEIDRLRFAIICMVNAYEHGMPHVARAAGMRALGREEL